MHPTENTTISPIANADFFLTSFIGMQEMLRAAVGTRAAKDQVSIGRNISHQWLGVQKRLDSMLDQAKSSISSVHLAVKAGHSELQVEKGGSNACNAASCMDDFVENYILIRSAVATRAEADGEAHGPASEAYWRSVLAKLEVMHQQARTALVPMTRAANIELLAEPAPVVCAVPAPAEEKGPAAQVHGAGANEYTVLLTLDTTASRELKVKADDIAHARRIAHAVAQEEQGAHFVLNDGNWVYPEQIRTNAVMDSDGVEVWNDGPVDQTDLDKLDEELPGHSM